VLAALTIIRVPAVPWFSQWADRTGRRVALLRRLSVASMLVWALLYPCHGFASIFLVSILSSVLSGPLLPLSENLILVHGTQNGVDFGRVRVVGSLAFLVSNLLTGWVLHLLDSEWIWYLGMCWWLIIASSSTALPEVQMSRGRTEGSRIRSVLERPDFVLAVLIAGLVTGSHAVYYGHSANLWIESGLSKTVIGMLWATGVLAEIVLFLFQRSWTGHLRPSQMMILGATGGILRWLILSETTDLWWLFPAQLLHASSFAATHLGMLRYLHRYLPKDQFATGQGLYSAIASGVFLGSAFLFTGPLVSRFGLGAYLVSLLYCVLALALGLWLRIRKKRSQPV